MVRGRAVAMARARRVWSHAWPCAKPGGRRCCCCCPASFMCGACTLPAARRCSCRTCGLTAITTRDMGWRSSPRWHSARPRWCRWPRSARATSGGRRSGVGRGAPWLIHPRPDAWITWKESQVNSEARRAWTREAAAYLGAALPPRVGHHHHVRRHHRHLSRGRHSVARDADLGQLAALAGGRGAARSVPVGGVGGGDGRRSRAIGAAARRCQWAAL